MYGMSFVTAFLTLYMMLMTSWLNAIAVSATASMMTATAGHLAIYSSLVSEYAQANPGYTGSVSDASAAFPSWFQRLPCESNYVSGGTAFVYSTPSSRAAGMAMARQIGGSSTGIDDSGTLTVPGLGATGIALPGVIPTGSLVVMQ